MKLKTFTPWEKSYDKSREQVKRQRYYFANKVPPSQGYGFSIVMYGYESWIIKKAECRRMDAFELWCWRLLRVPWTARRSKQSIWKGNQPWIFIGRTDTEAPILWPPDAKSRVIGKDPHAGKDWGQEKGITKDEIADSMDMSLSKLQEEDREGQGSLACCSQWDRKELDMS